MTTSVEALTQRLTRLPGPARWASAGVMSGVLSAWVPGPPFHIAESPYAVDLLMVLAGLWFGLVVAAIVWRAAPSGWLMPLLALLATWIAWEAAVNVAILTAEGWLKATGLGIDLRYAMGGALAGLVGAALTWTAVAALSGRLGNIPGGLLISAAGAALGTLLAAANAADAPVMLFVPWQAAVAAGLAQALGRE